MRFFKEALVLVTILFSLSLISFSQAYTGNPQSIPASGIISYSSKPYVDGTVIKDPSGNPVRLQGFNVEPRDMDEEGMQWLKSRGFNYIRITFLWHRFEPQQDRYSSTYFGYLDNLLNLCQEYGIYANLCFMQWQWSPYFTYYLDSEGTGFPEWVISGGGYADSSYGLRECIADFFLKRGSQGEFMRQEFFEFWDYLINRYKNNPYLCAYEIFNEPTIAKSVRHVSGVPDGIMNLYKEWTETFRQIDSRTIIIYHHIGDGATKVEYANVVWTKSWYDVAYEGYDPSWEYSDLVERLQNLKDIYNTGIGTPFLISEMGFIQGTSGAEKWIRDTFDVARNIGLNEGFECWAWYIYSKGTKYGFQTPRNWYGSDTWIVPVLQEYLGNTK